MAEQHHSQERPLVLQPYHTISGSLPGHASGSQRDRQREANWKEKDRGSAPGDENELSRQMKPNAKNGSDAGDGRRRWWWGGGICVGDVQGNKEIRGQWNRGQEKQETEERERGEKETELSATLLPVLVKCCVLSKRQPRMCQPSHLTLPNGLLNADIKLTRSFALPFSSLSLSSLRSHYLSFSPCPSPCHSLVLSLSFTLSLSCSVCHPLAPRLSLFSCGCFSSRTSPSITPPWRFFPCRLSLHLQLLFFFFFINELNICLSSPSVLQQAP